MTTVKRRISEWVADKQTGISKRMRTSQFDELPIRSGDVVFLGDSITEGGLWNEWFPAVAIRNRGVGGDTSREVLSRVHSATVDGVTAVFLLIGTNDVTLSVPDEEIVSNVTQIIRALRTDSPSSPVFLNSVMPRRQRFARRLVGLNGELERVARQEGATWIDNWPTLSDGDGALRPAFSLDTIHLNGAGYAAWVAVLRPFLESVMENPGPR